MPYNPSTDEFLVNTDTVGQQFFPAVTRLASGNILAVWASEPASQRVITAQMFDAGGNRIGSPFNLTAPSAGTQISPDVVPLANGGFALSWTAAPGPVSNIKIQFFDEFGAPAGAEIVLDPASLFSSHDSDMAVLANGSVAIAWTGNNGAGAEIGGAIVTPNGLVQYFPVNTTAAGHQVVPSVAALADGNFVVTWSDFSGLDGDTDGGIKAQIFDTAGARVGGEFLVNSTTPGPQSPSFVEALPSGGFVIVWNGFGQLFDAAGNKVGGEFPIPGSDALAVLPDGGFIVSYQASDGDLNGLYAQHYAADATPIGGSFQVNQETADQQTHPAVTTLVTGDLFVAWMDLSGVNGDPDGFGIMARTFTTGTLGTAGPDGFNGTPADDHFLGLGGDDVFSLGIGGDDRVDGGPGDDYFYFGYLDGTHIVVGGTGVDRVILYGQYPDLNLTATSLFGIEAIGVQSTGFRLFGEMPTFYDISTVDENVAAGERLILNALKLKFDEWVIFDGSAETDGFFLLQGGAGADSLFGGERGDSLFGGEGDDILDGGGGADTMTGGNGNDSYYIDNPGDVFVESGGAVDSVYARINYALLAGAQIEYLAGYGLSPGQGIALQGNELAQTIVGGAGDDILAGGGGSDSLIGNDGNDQLDGGAGIDVMAGGAGNDIYFVQTAGDSVQEGAGGGADTIYTNSDFTLRADVEVEVLAANGFVPAPGIALRGNGFAQSIVGGSGTDHLFGGGGNDFLTGNAGSDQLDGGTGADVMEGGDGDDLYFVDHAGDIVQDSLGGGGFDAVYASADFALGAGARIELLATTGLAPGQAIFLAGNEYGQSVVGASGNDTLLGGGGNDLVEGGGGNDLIDGGAGLDGLRGGAGADIFRFLSAADSNGAGDSLYDFVSGTDRIDLAAVDANTGIAGDQAFTFIGSGAFTNVAGQLRAELSDGVLHILGDTNGDGVADLHILAYNAPTINAGDFVL